MLSLIAISCAPAPVDADSAVLVEDKSEGTCPCPGDTNDSGAVNIDDLLAVLSTWGACSECATDIDGDGIVGEDDIDVVLERWGTCPTECGETEPPDYETELQYCVDLVNDYRAILGLPAVTRDSALEAYAAEGAEYDAGTGVAHSHFIATGGGGIAYGENEIPGWPIDWYGDVMTVIDLGTEMMWDEGPPPAGGYNHYAIMTGSYTKLGCGIHVTDDGDVWVVQDFGY